jgi:tetratricopeptide (TPR) repeat protein
VELAYAGVKYRQGHFDEARTWAERAAVSAEAGADRTRLAYAYDLSHLVAVNSGRRAPEQRDEALAILEEAGDLARLTKLQNNVGIEAYYDGRWDDALDWYRRSGESAARIGDVMSVARAQINEAEILSDRSQFDEARALLDQALRVFRAADYPIGVALTTSNLGRVMARSGQFEDAHRLLEDALAQFEGLGAEAWPNAWSSRAIISRRWRCWHLFANLGRRSSRSPNGSPATPWCSHGRGSRRRSGISSVRSKRRRRPVPSTR